MSAILPVTLTVYSDTFLLASSVGIGGVFIPSPPRLGLVHLGGKYV